MDELTAQAVFVNILPILLRGNRKHPKLEYNATLISFVVAMLTFSDQSLSAPSQE